MAYTLLLSEPKNEITRDVGENVFVSDLPSDYKVYLFYYPAAMPDQELEKGLRSLGDLAGGNLFVNIGRLNDPNFDKITQRFGIKPLPVVVMTGTAPYASAPDGSLTSYVRIDSKSLLKTTDKAMECIQELFNLFIQGKIAEAMKEVRKDKLQLIVARLGQLVTESLRAIWKFIDEREISVSIIEGKFELKRSGK
ncbi:MAG TPA: hypothetical protein VLX12_03515 [Syntrophorhabdales bacterium]|nr:hypothetical protein [Syntrophorhabdales bacterium]